jgi:pyruvate dehydrogenase E2 component (dihydrolipoamide acetyltransferase)
LSQLREVKVPDLGNIDRAAIIEIPIKPGDTINVEDTLITLESDKASMDIPSPYAGIVQAIHVKIGDKVGAGNLIVSLETQETASKTQSVPEPETAKIKSPEKLETPSVSQPESQKETSEPTSDVDHDIYAGPTVRRLAREIGIDLKQVTPTGQKGRILKEDLQKFVREKISGFSQTALPKAPVVDFQQFGAVETKLLTRIKKLTAAALHRNWLLVPHVTQFAQADITELENFRKAQQAEAEKQHVKLTPLAFIMKAVVAALKKFENFNASLSSDGSSLIVKKYFHIGIAVDTKEGLVVPVIRDVDQKNLLALAKELSIISERARNQQLNAQDLQGSSFTISSLGGIGGSAFTPIINVPDVAILGVSKASINPVYQNNVWVPRLLLPLSLSYDHRVIDGAEGARFIVYLTQCLSDIRQWLL